jgi:hypothetical protein
VNPDLVEQVLQDYAGLHRPDTDPELAALRAAILLEDVFEVTLSDTDFDPAVLADPSAVTALVARRRGTL